MARNIVITPGEYYHVYNRGVDKRTIFIDETDFARFITLLYACNGTRAVDLEEQGKDISMLLKKGFVRGEQLVEICAYVLMPNHFHIMVKEIKENGLSQFMQKLGNAYTGYFNKKYQRSGSLFEGPYKARHASHDPYCSYVTSYIHLNPVKLIEPKWKETGIKNRQKAEQFLLNYKYSSYIDYCGKQRIENEILTPSSLPNHSVNPGDFQKEVQIWLNYEIQHRKV